MTLSTSILAGSIAAVADFAPDTTGLAAIRVVNQAAVAAARAARDDEELIRFNEALYGDRTPAKNTFNAPSNVAALPFLRFRQGVTSATFDTAAAREAVLFGSQDAEVPAASLPALDAVVRKYAPAAARRAVPPLKGSRYEAPERQDQATDVETYLPEEGGPADDSLIQEQGPHEDGGYQIDPPTSGLFPTGEDPVPIQDETAESARSLSEAQDALIEDPFDSKAWLEVTDHLTRKEK